MVHCGQAVCVTSMLTWTEQTEFYIQEMSLADDGTDSVNDFTWQQQLRYYVEHDD